MKLAGVRSALQRAAVRVDAVGTDLPAPPITGGPAAVAAWWRGLDESARTAVAADHPDWLGNLDGVPARVRDVANRARISGERAVLEARRTGLADRLASSRLPDWFGNRLRRLFSSDDEALWYLDQKLADLAVIEAQITHEHVYLLMLDVRGARRGLAALSIGDPDAATHISVTTPGLGTTVNGSLDGMRRQAEELTKVCVTELRRAGGGRDREVVANIAWLGYVPPNFHAPNRLVGALGGVGLGRSRIAVAAAVTLHEFYRGLTVTGRDVHLTALGHSYGSLVTSLALGRNGGELVDDVVFYGSPGLSPRWSPRHFRSAGDYGLAEGHAFVMRGAEDWIAELGWFGGDPYEPPSRFVALSAAAGVSPDGRFREGAPNHADYPRTVGHGAEETLRMSGYNLAVVVVGLPELAVRA